MKNIMMSDLEKYKTELCAHYEEKGSCPIGINCKFAHGQLELRSRLSNVKRKNNKLEDSFIYGIIEVPETV